jgi:hypothetical protein
MEPLNATIEEFAADGYTHVQCFCPRCRAIRLRPISWLPRISMGLTTRNCQHGCAVSSAAVLFIPLSRGALMTLSAGLWVEEDNR